MSGSGIDPRWLDPVVSARAAARYLAGRYGLSLTSGAWTWKRSWGRAPEVVTVLEGARGSGARRGLPGLARFPGCGVYPACSLHGAMNAVGGGKWRCLVEGCNVGCTVKDGIIPRGIPAGGVP